MPNFLDDSFLLAPLEADEEPVVASPFDHLYHRPGNFAQETKRQPSIELLTSTLTLTEVPDNELQCHRSHEQHDLITTEASGVPVHDGLHGEAQPKSCTNAIIVLPSTTGSYRHRLALLREVCEAPGTTNPGCTVRVEQDANKKTPYLRVTTQDPRNLAAQIAHYQAMLDSLRSDQAAQSFHHQTLVEPLRLDPAKTIVALQQVTTVRGLKNRRPRLQVNCSATLLGSTEFSQARRDFRQILTKTLIDQMKKPHYLNSVVKVVFGHLSLQTWKGTSSSLTDFTGMLIHPRTISTVPEHFGDVRTAAKIVSAIRRDKMGLFTPADHNLSLAAEAIPSYHIEVQTPIGWLVADLERPAVGHDSGYNIGCERIRLPQPQPLFQIQVLRLGKAVDWMVETMADDESRPPAKKVLAGAKIIWACDAIGDFPRLLGCPEFNNLTIKTRYEFIWFQEMTDYVIEISVFRRWETAASCAQGKNPSTTSLSFSMREGSGGSINEDNVDNFIMHVQTVARLVDDIVKECTITTT